MLASTLAALAVFTAKARWHVDRQLAFHQIDRMRFPYPVSIPSCAFRRLTISSHASEPKPLIIFALSAAQSGSVPVGACAEQKSKKRYSAVAYAVWGAADSRVPPILFTTQPAVEQVTQGLGAPIATMPAMPSAYAHCEQGAYAGPPKLAM